LYIPNPGNKEYFYTDVTNQQIHIDKNVLSYITIYQYDAVAPATIT